MGGGFGAANLDDLRGPAGGGDGLLARAPGPAFHAGFGLFGVATFFGCEGPGVAFLCRDGPGVAFLAGDLPRAPAFCAGRELLDPVGVVVRVSGLPREGGGALPALWRPAFDAGFGDGVRPGDWFGEPARLLGDLDCFPGPAFHAGLGDGAREPLPTLPDRADPGLAFRPGDVPRRGGGALLALWRVGPGVGEPARLNDFAPRPL